MDRRAQVLLADDNADDVVLMQFALQKAGIDCELLPFPDGGAIVSHLQECGAGGPGRRPYPAAVILDARLPRMDGFEVLGWIRQQPRLRDLPVIMLSGSWSERDRQRALELGANVYVDKPADYWGLIGLVKGQLRAWLEPLPAAA